MGQSNKQILKELKQALPVVRFLHYREFLEQLYREAKNNLRPYSYVKFAQDLGFGEGDNILRLVIISQRTLSLKAGARIADALAFTGPESKYWLALIKFCNAKKPGELEQATQKMLQMKASLLPAEIDQSKLAYFSEWYHSVIREMAGRSDFQLDPKWVQTHLGFSLGLPEIKRSLELLTRLGLIYYDAKKGRHCRSEDQVDTGADARGIAFVRYHEKMIEQSKHAISRVPKSKRAIVGATMLLSEAAMELLRKRVHQLIDEAMELEAVDKHNASDVVQLNMQLFPFTNDSGKD